MNIFVGNLSFGVKEPDLQKAFSAFGTVLIAAIVMEKKGKKSRGFGFVEMPDEQEALSAIAALNGKELLGRPINVMPALPKKPKSKFFEKRSKFPPQPGVGSKESFFRPKAEGHSRHDPSFRRTGRYKEGKRSISYAKRRLVAGVTVPVPERKFKPNPMRWRKKPKWAKPSGKTEGEPKPREKRQSGSRPWEKTANRQYEKK